MEDFNDNVNNNETTANDTKVAVNSGRFYKGMPKPEHSGRKKGTPNKRTKELIELFGDYNPAESLLEILKSDRVPIDLKIKINLDLMGYLYPKRKSVESKEQVLLFTNPETVGEVTDYLDI